MRESSLLAVFTPCILFVSWLGPGRCLALGSLLGAIETASFIHVGLSA